jgi:hypothetical protein
MVNMKQKDKGNEAQGLLLLYYVKKSARKSLDSARALVAYDGQVTNLRKK